MTDLVQELMAKEIEGLRRDVMTLRTESKRLHEAIWTARNLLNNGRPPTDVVAFLTSYLEPKP